jgi:predicted aspartyl protease
LRSPGGFGNWTTGVGLVALSFIGRPAPADTSVAFKMVTGRLVVVPVLIDNRGPFDFVLDTGTNTTVVDTELARLLGVRPIDRVSMTSPGGTRIVPRVRLQSLTLGPKVVQDLEALCVDPVAFRRLGSVRGIVGQRFLSRFNYLLSYQDRRLEFRDGDAAETPLRGVRLPFDADEGRMVVAAAAPASRNGRRLVLDSGASQLVLFDRPEQGPGGDVEEDDGTAAFSTSHADMAVRTGRIRHLAVGGQTFHDLPLVLVPETSSAEARVEDGLLPTNLFRAVYFDNRQRFVLLNPRGRHEASPSSRP